MSEKSELYIPINIRKRKEIVEGFGNKELRQSLIALVIGLIIGLFVFFIFSTHIFVIVGIPIIFFAGAVIFLKKDKTNTNMIDMIQEMYRFSKSQKKYEYKYCNIHEKKVEKQKNGKENF